ncbi:MAG: glycosyltransferase family 2 protein [Xanthomonadales bacterium]|nr:glycosyltransferase family 2 protein [Xanthomonadales bacterium]
MATRLSLVLTTLDNAGTLAAAIRSVPFADEVLVLDSHSSDDTVEIARTLGGRVVQESFRGYGPQKQRAVDLAAPDWVLLLDADEAVDEVLAAAICETLSVGPRAAGYRLRREEWLYWRWPAPGTGLTDHLRLFDRRRMRMSEHPVHAAPVVDGPVAVLPGRLRHYGQRDLDAQVARINDYSSQAAAWRIARGRPLAGLRLLLAPPLAFLREYLLRRQFLNGWAGLINARVAEFHALLRHAKEMEARRRPSGGPGPGD